MTPRRVARVRRTRRAPSRGGAARQAASRASPGPGRADTAPGSAARPATERAGSLARRLLASAIAEGETAGVDPPSASLRSVLVLRALPVGIAAAGAADAAAAFALREAP